ncbi:hypothetical protein [Spirillospora albida]|uniref:hypothetical protein n=1 Tax=Spirillospora albida TaxID=58123 RepID=UPI0004BE7994|nr:hypothetical protein [Spirillospora albida]
MIILSGVLVVVAIALLVAGIVAGNGDSAAIFGLDALTVIYISIAVSIVSALCLAIGVFLRRKELFGSGASPAPARARKRKKSAKAVLPPPAKASRPAPGKSAGPKPAEGAEKPAVPADDAVEIPALPADVPDDALVFVVRGRKRYHLDTCRQLAGRDTEELTYAEAKEEGFSPCTACMPDTALAARAAVSVPAAREQASEKVSGKPSEVTRVDLEAGAEGPGGLAGLAKPSPAPSGAPEDARPTEIFRKSAEPDREDTPEPLWASSETVAESPWKSSTATDGPRSTAPDSDVAAADEKPADADYAPATGEPDENEQDAASEPVQPTPGGDAPDEAADDGAGGAEDPQVRILSGTKRYHRTDCALIEDIGDEADDLEALSRAEAKARGCTPCLVCRPDA